MYFILNHMQNTLTFWKVRNLILNFLEHNILDFIIDFILMNFLLISWTL